MALGTLQGNSRHSLGFQTGRAGLGSEWGLSPATDSGHLGPLLPRVPMPLAPFARLEQPHHQPFLILDPPHIHLFTSVICQPSLTSWVGGVLHLRKKMAL